MRGLIVILLFSVACNHYTKEEGGTKNGNMRSEVVQIIHYSWLDSINDKVASNLSIVKENDTVGYIYRGDNLPDSLYSYKISKGQRGDSVLAFLEKPVFLVDEQVIEINRKMSRLGNMIMIYQEFLMKN